MSGRRRLVVSRRGLHAPWGRVAISAALNLLTTSGCSLLFVTPPAAAERPRDTPPARPAETPPARPIDCTSSQAAPVIDSVVAGLQLARTIVAFAADDSDYQQAPISRDADIGLGLGLTTLFLASAGYGFHTTSRCGALRRQERPPSLPVPPGPAPPVAAGEAVAPAAECRYDAECGGTRICEQGRCIEFASNGAAQ